MRPSQYSQPRRFFLSVWRGEREVFVWVVYTPGRPGKFWGKPEDCYPPEPSECDVVEGPDDLSEEELREIERKAARMYQEIVEYQMEKQYEAFEEAYQAEWEDMFSVLHEP
jgi:hypothetical protein